MTKRCAARVVLLGALTAANALAQSPDTKPFAPEQIQKGAEIYESRCAVCHGAHMMNPPWAIDLGTFPRDQRARFVDSVTNGVRNMPPWGDVLTPGDVEALWAYLVAGERKN